MGLEVDGGRDPAWLWVERVEVRVEGQRIRVGAVAPTYEVGVDAPEESDEDDGGILMMGRLFPSAASFPRTWTRRWTIGFFLVILVFSSWHALTVANFKVKKFNPTLGEHCEQIHQFRLRKRR